MRYGKHINPSTPQSQPIPGREKDMTKNAAGGYVFSVNRWQRLTRFLILGTEGGGYYINEQRLTFDNLTSVNACIKEDGVRVVNEIVAISEAGRAVKNDPAIFALAMVMKTGDDKARQAAYAAVPKVCRIGTHLFTLAQALSDLGKGWGRGTKRAFANWYLEKDADQAAFQAAKYQSRNGWSNADILRLAHPKTTNASLNAVFKWAVDGEVTEGLPKVIVGFEKAKKATSAKEVVSLIKEYNLPRECVPTQYLTNIEVWRVLLETMPLTATIRNLGNMTKIGLLTATSDETQLVVARLQDAKYIQRSRVHPITILLALKQYQSGGGYRSTSNWTPVQKIVSALDKAFYLAFENVEATGKKFFIGIDVSGSMSSPVGDTNLRSCEVSAAMAMTIMKKEPKYWAYGFCDKLVDLKIHDGMDLATVAQNTLKSNFGSTDCAAAINYAMDKGLDPDVFIIITDNDTWAGKRNHPSQALAQYRKKMNKPDAKMIVLATYPSQFTIADPNDPGQLDIAGFDTTVPQVVAEFSKM
jgi:60 kDa SS-A/Ro ribonucleoprotein